MNNLMIKYRDPVYLILFFLTAGPGPAQLILNKYTITFFPLLMLAFTVYAYRSDIVKLNFNDLLLNRSSYAYAAKAAQWGIYAHAASVLISRSTGNGTADQLLEAYPIMAMHIVLIGPVLEEIVYRKIMFGYLHKLTSFWLSAVVSSFVFALMHFSLERFLAYFCVGLILCLTYKKSGSLFPCIIAHLLLNLISVIVMTLKV